MSLRLLTRLLVVDRLIWYDLHGECAMARRVGLRRWTLRKASTSQLLECDWLGWLRNSRMCDLRKGGEDAGSSEEDERGAGGCGLKSKQPAEWKR